MEIFAPKLFSPAKFKLCVHAELVNLSPLHNDQPLVGVAIGRGEQTCWSFVLGDLRPVESWSNALSRKNRRSIFDRLFNHRSMLLPPGVFRKPSTRPRYFDVEILPSTLMELVHSASMRGRNILVICLQKRIHRLACSYPPRSCLLLGCPSLIGHA